MFQEPNMSKSYDSFVIFSCRLIKLSISQSTWIHIRICQHHELGKSAPFINIYLTPYYLFSTPIFSYINFFDEKKSLLPTQLKKTVLSWK